MKHLFILLFTACTLLTYAQVPEGYPANYAKAPRFKALIYYTQHAEEAHVQFAEQATTFFKKLNYGDGFVLDITTDFSKYPYEKLKEYNVIISREKLAIPGELLKKSSSLQDYRDMVEHLSSTAGIVLKLLKVLGVCICILIVVMICGMITEESSRNISMLEILGYRDREVRSFVLSSGHLLVPVGFVIGVPLGYLTAYSMVLASAQSSGMRMSLPVRAETILAAFVFVLVAYILALALSGRKIHRVDMAESLKNVEE